MLKLFKMRYRKWENCYIESFNGKLRDELLDREIFTTLEEAKILIAQWRREYNQVRPYSALGYHPPAPEAILTRVMVSLLGVGHFLGQQAQSNKNNLELSEVNLDE